MSKTYTARLRPRLPGVPRTLCLALAGEECGGMQGAQGADGSVGPQGDMGAPGPQGAQGADGTPGPQGDTGANGSQGAQGNAGSDGPQGAAGAQGPQGAAGSNGAQGAQGAPGAQGPAGSDGVQGAQGAAGSNGAQGAQGASGSNGAQGAQGAAGSNGAQGAQGTQGAAGGTWTTVKKTADQSKSSTTTLATDSELSFALAANTKYAVRGRIFFNTGATGDFKWRHAGPASPTLVRIKRHAIVPVATAFSGIAVDTAFSAADITITGTSAGEGYIEFEGIVQNGANAGTFDFRWAQNTSDVTATIVRAGSYLEWMAVP